MTAISLAKRDLLGVNMPLWKLLFPAALIHCMANMRGKKPVFRWGSATPWSEMQLSPLHVLDAALAGADIATIPFNVLSKLAAHPLTDKGLKAFLADWEKAKK